MWSIWILIVSSVAIVDYAVAQQDGSISVYSSRYNNLNIDTILASNRLVTNYVDCLLSRKPCPPEGKDLKRILPEALRTKCARCSNYQKESALKVITKLYYDYPRQYNLLRMKWDPTGEYHRRFEEYLQELQFNVIDGPTGSGIEQGTFVSQQPSVQTANAAPPAQPQRPIPQTSRPFVQSQRPVNVPNFPTPQSSIQNTINTGTPRPARNPEIISVSSLGTNSIQNTQNTLNNAVSSSSGAQPPQQPSISNRFGDDDLVGSAAIPSIVTSSIGSSQPEPIPQVTTTTTRATTTTTTTTTSAPAPATVRVTKPVITTFIQSPAVVQTKVKTVYTYNTRPQNIADQFFVSPVQTYRPVASPLIGLINSIGFKISNTAEFFAGLMTKTVQTM